MKSKIIVFDFDKTLSYSDTLFGFFSSAGKKNIAHPFKIVIYLFTMLLTKFKILSNTYMKNIGIILFLRYESNSIAICGFGLFEKNKDEQFIQRV